MAEATLEPTAVRQAGAAGRNPILDVLFRIVKSPIGAASMVVLIVLVLAAIFASVVGDPYKSSVDTFASPSLEHPFGTDDIGRDQLARVLHGARISLKVGFIATFFGCIIGAIVGMISGFVGGWVDLVVQRVVDAMLAIPGIVLALFFVSVFNPSVETGMAAIVLVIIPFNSRVIRSAVLATKESVYVEAARSIGATPPRVLLRHVLPNIVAPILIMMSTVLGAAILIEAGLAFLGMGAQPPTPSWGLMLSGTGRRFMETAPWLAYFPAAAISLTVLAFNLLGDVVRDVLDPRLRGSR
jgi:ABC-type dipeptide/oligopeptide/nickel transport system permease subunit